MMIGIENYFIRINEGDMSMVLDQLGEESSGDSTADDHHLLLRSTLSCCVQLHCLDREAQTLCIYARVMI
ncbi:hypothetical protein IEQ34_000374 [Dendrobium chrysotoxum]|uniref:Uncharacterized protein n=1 Tax=Dendrobium chrysotoxum TaxID=161865 RepID=A0AAV7HNX5_DENCH|nr:hypothetical protein IEQ34_000374 [Dendrobium chrysotoxum]